MSQGFAIEFSVDVADAMVEQFRVLVAGERVRVFEAFANPFGETVWVEPPGPARGVEETSRIIAWAFDGFVRALGSLDFNAFMKAVEALPRGHSSSSIPTPGISHRESPNGIQIIELGTIQRRQ